MYMARDSPIAGRHRELLGPPRSWGSGSLPWAASPAGFLPTHRLQGYRWWGYHHFHCGGGREETLFHCSLFLIPCCLSCSNSLTFADVNQQEERILVSSVAIERWPKKARERSVFYQEIEGGRKEEIKVEKEGNLGRSTSWKEMKWKEWKNQWQGSVAYCSYN